MLTETNSPLNCRIIGRPDLMEADLDVLAAHLRPRRNGLGRFIVLVLANSEY
jgi:hypothetical protein